MWKSEMWSFLAQRSPFMGSRLIRRLSSCLTKSDWQHLAFPHGKSLIHLAYYGSTAEAEAALEIMHRTIFLNYANNPWQADDFRLSRAGIRDIARRMSFELLAFEQGVTRCCNVIVTLLGLKKFRRNDKLAKLDRFLIQQLLAVEIWTTRTNVIWHPTGHLQRLVDHLNRVVKIMFK